MAQQGPNIVILNEAWRVYRREPDANIALRCGQHSDDDDDGDGDDERYYRILIDGIHIKHLVIPVSLLPVSRFHHAYSHLVQGNPFDEWPDLPPLEDRWAEARISRTPGGALIARPERATIPGLENTWHPNMINCLDIRIWQSFPERVNAHKGKLIANNNYIGLLPGSTVIVKKDPRSVRYSGQEIEAENNVYQRIQGHGIGPDFLGHLVEAERVTGFVLNFLEDFYPAGPEDLEICQRTLSKLHALGIRHGNISRYNFLVHNNGTEATLIDFARSVRGLAPELEAEMNALPEELEETDPKRVINMNGSLYPIHQGEVLTLSTFLTSVDGRPRLRPEPDTIP